MEYTITKKKIKNFIIRIYPDATIKVSVPLSATKIQIEKFLSNKKDWIEKNIEKIKECSGKRQEDSKNSIKILGSTREIRLIKSELDMIRLSERKLYIYHSKEHLENDEIAKRISLWGLEFLEQILKKYLEKYLEILNTSIKEYRIKKMKSAWGIYHLRGNYITFNSLLIEKQENAIEYVVVHELCHIFFQNHQKEFWELVEKYLPDYKKAREILKKN